MEEDWDHKTIMSKSSSFTKKKLKKEWKVHAAKFCISAVGVCGINTRALLAYLMRDQLIPTDEVDDDADDYPDLDYKLITRHPIIHKDHLVLDLDKLKKGGPRKKVANVNAQYRQRQFVCPPQDLLRGDQLVETCQECCKEQGWSRLVVHV